MSMSKIKVPNKSLSHELNNVFVVRVVSTVRPNITVETTVRPLCLVGSKHIKDA